MEALEQLKRRLGRDVEDACRDFVSRVQTEILDAERQTVQRTEGRPQVSDASSGHRETQNVHVDSATRKNDQMLLNDGVQLQQNSSAGMGSKTKGLDCPDSPKDGHGLSINNQILQCNAEDQVADLKRQLHDLKGKLDSVSRELVVYKKAQGILSRGYEREKRMNTELEAEVDRLRQKHKSDKDLMKAYRAASERWRGRLHAELTVSGGDSGGSPSPSGQSLIQAAAKQTLPDHAANSEIVQQVAEEHQRQLPLDGSAVPGSAEYRQGEHQPLPSSQTTEDDETGQAFVPNQLQIEQEEEPIIVSSRQLKRKRDHGASREKRGQRSKTNQSRGTPEQPFTIKQEDASLPDIVVDAMAATHDSNQDLDVDIDPLATPQKNRMQKMDRMRRRLEVPLPAERYPRAASDPLDLVPGPNGQFVEKEKRARTDRRSLNLAEPDPPPKSASFSGALQPLPINHIVNKLDARAILSHDSKRQRKTIDNGEQSQGISEPLGANEVNVPDRLNPVQKQDKKASRVQALLEDQALNKIPLANKGQSTRHEQPKYPSSFDEDISNEINVKQEPHDISKGPVTFKEATTTRRRGRKSEPISRMLQDQPEDEPLRARPLSRLTLEDFKINPRANQGISYAFAEPVRTNEAKRCLPGCTDPSCCGGAFRALAAATGGQFTRKRGLWDDSQDDTDQALLEEYMGDDRARIGRLSATERDELLLQARAAKLARQHGKHRTAHARRSTPAGFWDADWPSTQQAAENREKTVQTVREAIAERRAEAMRSNGRWMFRDE